jgi:hypothetical protein
MESPDNLFQAVGLVQKIAQKFVGGHLREVDKLLSPATDPPGPEVLVEPLKDSGSATLVVQPLNLPLKNLPKRRNGTDLRFEGF